MDKINTLNLRKNGFSLYGKKNYPPHIQLEPIHQLISLKFSLSTQTVEGFVTTTIKANVEGADSIVFNAEDIQIEEIFDVDDNEIIWAYDGNKIDIQWSKPFSKAEKRLVRIAYSLLEPIAGLYFSYPDAKYPDAPKYVVMDLESERARYWLPSLDHPTVRCTIDFFITAKSNYTILANGAIIDEQHHADGTKTVHWEEKFPCPSYLITIAIGDFVKYTDESVDVGAGTIPVEYYASTKYTPEDLKRSFDRTPAMLDWFYKKLKVPLEWEKYYQITTAEYSGAMENITLVTWNDFAVLDDILCKELAHRIDGVNVHEMAHSWFGDMVVIKEFAHTWLKESWAVYMEVIYLEENSIMEDALYELYCDAQSYKNESDSKYARPIVTNEYDTSWSMYDSHTYPGGAWRLHMLRHIVGERFFWDATIDYLRDFKGKVVETIDFQRKLEQHSGLDLNKFFDQWLYSPGYPKLECSFNYDKTTKMCSLKVKQKQEDDKKGIKLFEFPLEVSFQMNDSSILHKTFKVEDEEHTFYFACDTKPDVITIDPDYKLLCSLSFNPGTDLLINQLKTINYIAKIRAAKELSKEGKLKGLQAIFDTYSSELHRGLKIEYGKALAKSPSFKGIEFLLTILETESDPTVLQSLISTLESTRDSSVFTAMKKILNREEVLYLAFSSALQVIGSQRTDEALNYLLSYTIPHDYKQIIEEGLFQALGKTRKEKAITHLSDLIPYGIKSKSLRSSIVTALGEASLWADKPLKSKVIDEFIALLKQDKHVSVCLGAVRALVKLETKRAASAIEGFKTRLPKQFYPYIDRLLKKLKTNEKKEEELKALRKEFDEMKNLLKKLTARIDELEALSKKEE